MRRERESKKECEVAIKHLPSGIIHKGHKGGKTGCGINTKRHADDWVETSKNITCDQEGCKNVKVF